jgi:hypothetical protein
MEVVAGDGEDGATDARAGRELRVRGIHDRVGALVRDVADL